MRDKSGDGGIFRIVRRRTGLSDGRRIGLWGGGGQGSRAEAQRALGRKRRGLWGGGGQGSRAEAQRALGRKRRGL
jgi:hypothetical protein